MRPNERVGAITSAVRAGGQSETRDHRQLVIVDGPNPVTGKDDEVIGVEVHIELRKHGELFNIDGHRIFINPPTQVVEGRGEQREVRSDPRAAFWSVLWDSIEQHPGRPT